ncbi:MAG: hypothetical protein FWF59_13865 [Turicibacter sp.]|nr:hypothetical protein [Turicibacter sp.]
MKIYFLGSYVNGAVNTPARDALHEEIEGKLHPEVEYIGAQIDKASRMYSLMAKLKADLKEADVLFLHPSRLGTSYFEIGEALNQGKEIWVLAERENFGERGVYPYSRPNFKYIAMGDFAKLLSISSKVNFLAALSEGENR